MPDVKTYLKYRNIFLKLGYDIEVQKLDIHYKLNFLYNKEGRLIKLLQDKT